MLHISKLSFDMVTKCIILGKELRKMNKNYLSQKKYCLSYLLDYSLLELISKVFFNDKNESSFIVSKSSSKNPSFFRELAF